MFDRNVGSSKLVVELARGIEPPTCGLQNRCSAVELRQRPRASAMVAYFTTGEATFERIFRKGADCVIVGASWTLHGTMITLRLLGNLAAANGERILEWELKEP